MKKKLRIQKALDKEFSNRLIVIDEAHNIRTSESKELKRTSENLLQLVKYTDSLKLLLLSATPMFDKAKEIVWLLNLMNINDNRFRISESDIFDANDNFKRDDKGINIGRRIINTKSYRLYFLRSWRKSFYISLSYLARKLGKSRFNKNKNKNRLEISNRTNQFNTYY